MSKRKREIKKRKKFQEETQAQEIPLAADPVEQDTAPVEEEINLPADADPGELLPVESPIDDSQIVAAPARPARKKTVQKKKAQDPPAGTKALEGSWFGQNKENFLLGLLILYVLLLGLGTAGELFEIEWILNLPLFR